MYLNKYNMHAIHNLNVSFLQTVRCTSNYLPTQTPVDVITTWNVRHVLIFQLSMLNQVIIRSDLHAKRNNSNKIPFLKHRVHAKHKRGTATPPLLRSIVKDDQDFLGGRGNAPDIT